MAKVTILRSKQLTAKLRALRQATQVPVRKALADAADEMVVQMRTIVPDDPRTQGPPYDLKSTIKWRFQGEQGGGSDAKTGKSAATSVTITAGDEKNPEARWLEFGTKPHVNKGEFAGSVNPGIAPRGYFFGTYRRYKAAAKRKINAAIRKAVRDVAAK